MEVSNINTLTSNINLSDDEMNDNLSDDLESLTNNVNNITVNDSIEYNRIISFISQIELFINNLIHTKVSNDLYTLVNKLYSQNNIYLTKVSFSQSTYTNCDEYDDFNEYEIKTLAEIKEKLDESINLIDELPHNIKLWNITYVYNILKICHSTYNLILTII